MSSEGSWSPPRRGNPAGGKQDKQYFSKEMVISPPPFLVEQETVARIAPVPSSSQAVSHAGGSRIGGPRTEDIPIEFQTTLTEHLKAGGGFPHKKRTRHPKDGPDADPSKRTRKELPPPPPKENIVTSALSQLAAPHISESELKAWTTGSFEANTDALTKAAAEVFIRQINSHRELRNMVQATIKLDKDNKILKNKLDDARRANVKLVEDRKQKILDATTSLDKDLRESRSLVTKIKEEHSIAIGEAVRENTTLKTQISELEAKVTALEASRDEDIRNATALGSKNFMKGFMSKIPDFDWGQLGASTVGYAAKLRKEMEQ